MGGIGIAWGVGGSGLSGRSTNGFGLGSGVVGGIDIGAGTGAAIGVGATGRTAGGGAIMCSSIMRASSGAAGCGAVVGVVFDATLDAPASIAPVPPSFVVSPMIFMAASF